MTLLLLPACSTTPLLYPPSEHGSHRSLLEEGLAPEQIRARLGEPSRVHHVEGGEDWVYDYGSEEQPWMRSAVLHLRGERLETWVELMEG